MRVNKLLAGATGALAITAIGAGSALASGPATPVQHVVVIFQENVSFDHYFGTTRSRRTPARRASRSFTPIRAHRG